MNALASVRESLRRRTVRPRGFERPRFFDLGLAEDVHALELLLNTEPGLSVHDTITTQVAELLHTRSPATKRERHRDPDVAARFLNGGDPASYGCWVHYPWRRALVHVLPEPEFIELRSARNQLHVAPDEQRLLRTKTIGIVGLSVGHAMAVTLALEGVGGRFRLADFDHLELSNTNRVATGMTALGENKAVLAAQAMFEVDPYLDIAALVQGVHQGNAEAFLTQGGRLDLLLEECDDLPMKLRLRELARRLRICVMTETSQGGMLDIERFDLEPDRPPFHGLMGEISAAELERLTTREKAPFVLRFLRGADRMSVTLAASLVEIERTLAGWPQLASAVTLGGGVVTDTARRLLLGQLQRSGRFQIDLDTLVSDDAEAALREPELPIERQTKPRADVPAARIVSPPIDRLARWVERAAMAPSGGNVQPWSFESLADDQLVCRLHARASGSALDPERIAARVACAASFVNLELAARSDGYRTAVHWGGDEADPERVYACRFRREPALTPDALDAFVPLRCTNRRLLERQPLRAGWHEALESEVLRQDGVLVVHESDAALDGAARVLGELERVRVFSEPLYREMMNELADAPDAKLGIAIQTLELSGADRAALDILRRRDVVSFLRSLDRGQALVDLVRKPVRAAGALCFVHVAGRGAPAAYRGGMALQRVWLRATQLGLALQPVSAGLYMLAQLAHAKPLLPEWEMTELARLREPFERYFRVPEGRTGILLFRVFEGGVPTARSARLPVSEILNASFDQDLPRRHLYWTDSEPSQGANAAEQPTLFDPFGP
jgi:molybdopterin/thiamine biosynthesis adenylyltransferase